MKLSKMTNILFYFMKNRELKRQELYRKINDQDISRLIPTKNLNT